MHIVGICRFSMIGRGDWKAYRNVSEEELEKIYAEKEVELFSEERMGTRLATFSQLTLASVRAQTDKDFVFVVVSSDRMPSVYREKLATLCGEDPRIVLRFVPPIHIVDAQKVILEELGLPQENCVQFRLDDDDAVSSRFVERLRSNCAALWGAHSSFAVSFPNVIYSVLGGDTEGVYKWFNPYFGIGLAVRNPRRSVYGYAHYRIPQALVGLTDPSIVNLVTHHGINDTPRHPKERLKKRGLLKMDKTDLEQALNAHFGYLTREARELSGLWRSGELNDTLR